MNKDLDYVLNYMTKYVKNKYMHDSEPMLNYKDIEIVLNHIYELEQENKHLKEEKKKAIEYIKDRFDEEKGIWIIDCYELLEILGDKENE